MALDHEKLAKVIALIGSDQAGEALAAVRMAKSILQKEGLDLATVIAAGAKALSQPKPAASAGPAGAPKGKAEAPGTRSYGFRGFDPSSRAARDAAARANRERSQEWPFKRDRPWGDPAPKNRWRSPNHQTQDGSLTDFRGGNATMTLSAVRRRQSEKGTVLVVDARVETIDKTITYPPLTAYGSLAETLAERIRSKGGEATVTIQFGWEGMEGASKAVITRIVA